MHDARFYVYGVKLIDSKGERTPLALAQNDWQYADLSLLDFKDARGGNAPCSASNSAKNTSVTGTAPKALLCRTRVHGRRARREPSGRQDRRAEPLRCETAPPPLDIATMAWNWQAGRKFLLVEVDPPILHDQARRQKAKTWLVHLGSNGCKGNPATGEIVACAHRNRFTVTFDRFNAKTQQVNLDLTTLFKDSDIAADKGGAVGCMTALDDPECPPIFRAFGLNLVATAPGAADAGLQTKAGVSPVFSVGSGGASQTRAQEVKRAPISP